MTTFFILALVVSILNKCHFGINQELVNIFILQAEVFREANEIKREDQRCQVFSLLPYVNAHCLIDCTQWLISDYVNIVALTAATPEEHTAARTCAADFTCVAIERTEFEDTERVCI